MNGAGLRNWALTIAGVLALACVGYASIQVGLLAKRVDLNGTLAHLNSVLGNADGTITIIRDTAAKEGAYYDPSRPGGLPQQVQRTVVDLKGLIVRTDLGLNGPGGTIPTLTTTLRETSSLEQTAASSLNKTSEALDPILVNLAASSNALAQQTPPILANVLESSKQVVIISENSASTTHNIDMTTHDIQSFVHRETTPVRGTWNVIKSFLMEFAGPAAQVATAAK